MAVAVMVGLAVAVPGCADDATTSSEERRPDESTVSTATNGRQSTVSTTTDGDGPAPTATTRTDEPGAPRGRDEVPAGRDVVVTSITDGDTLRAGDERVRLIGIDTPEVSGDVECFGREATAALDRLVPPGTDVRLVSDVAPVDRYGRTLAYVYRLDDGIFVNLAMARDGYAVPLTVPPDVAHSQDLAQAAADARDAGRGLWSACGDAGDAATSSGVDPRAEDCDPAYPDACIPPAPPDLDCGDVAFRDFTVLAPDPHHFDGGGDGRGCESP